MLSYILEIQKKLISEYGFKENPKKPGLPIGVTDGEYPMKINGKIDNVIIKKGYINCCNFSDKDATE